MVGLLRISSVHIVLLIVAIQSGWAQEFRPLSIGPTNVENYVGDVVFITRASGSMTLSGSCAVTDVDKDVVSDSLLHPPQGPFQNAGEALRALSQVDPHIFWTSGVGGVLRVKDDRVPDDVLQIRLRRVHFRAATTLGEAISDVVSTPEVREYFRNNHIEYGTVFYHYGQGRIRAVPRLLSDLHDVTVSEALDRITAVFPGIWVYKECHQGSVRRVMITGH